MQSSISIQYDLPTQSAECVWRFSLDWNVQNSAQCSLRMRVLTPSSQAYRPIHVRCVISKDIRHLVKCNNKNDNL